MAAELEAAAAALVAVWEAARENATSRVSGVQLRVIMAVEQHDGINLRRLANRLGMLLSSASRLCDRLVAAGMLEREPGRLDRREISLHLTAEARQLLVELRHHRRQQLASILADMSPEGVEALLRGLEDFGDAVRRQHASLAYVEPWSADEAEIPRRAEGPQWRADDPSTVRSA